MEQVGPVPRKPCSNEGGGGKYERAKSRVKEDVDGRWDIRTIYRRARGACGQSDKSIVGALPFWAG